MSGVSSIVAVGQTTTLTGDVIIANSAPITLSQNTGAKTINVGIGALNSVVSVANQGGAVDFLFTPGSGQSYDAQSGNITFNTFAPNVASATPATDAIMVAQNLGGAYPLAWAGDGVPEVSTVAYLPGAVVIYSGTTYVCLVPQPIGSALPVAGAVWASIGGGGGGGGSSISNAGASLAIDVSGTLTFTNPDTASFVNQINLTTVVPTTTPGTNAGTISLTAGNQILLTSNGAGILLSSGDGDIDTQSTGNGDINISAGGTYAVTGTSGVAISSPVSIAIGIQNGEGTAKQIGLADDTGSIILVNSDFASNAPVSIVPSVATPSDCASGAVIFNCGAFDANIGYVLGSIVQENTASYLCIVNTGLAFPLPSPSTTPTNWLPIGGGGTAGGMVLSPASGAVWSNTDGYAVGEVVNQPSPTGIFVCIQTVPATTPPATNPTPSATPLFWTELVSSTTAPGSAMIYSYPFNNLIEYVPQNVVPDPAGGAYVCILATSVPTPPAVNPDPSADPTHWQPLGDGGGGSSISNTGASLAIDTTGSLLYTTPDTASNINQITLATMVPTTTPGANAGVITVSAGSGLFLTSGTGSIVASAEGGIVLDPLKGFITLNTNPAYDDGKVLINPNNGTGGLPGPGYIPPYNSGLAIYWTGEFVNTTNGYSVGAIVSYGSPSELYLCILQNPFASINLTPPDIDTTHWKPFVIFPTPPTIPPIPINILDLGAGAYPVPPATTNTTEAVSGALGPATAPLTEYTGNTGSDGFVSGGTGVALVAGGNYTLSYNLTFAGVVNAFAESTAQYVVYITFNQSTPATVATSYYEVYDSGVVGGAVTIPNANFSGQFNFKAPPDATFIGIQIMNALITGAEWPSTLDPAPNGIAPSVILNPANGLLLTTY